LIPRTEQAHYLDLPCAIALRWRGASTEQNKSPPCRNFSCVQAFAASRPAVSPRPKRSPAALPPQG